jgi:precorrin-2/cobalt-factor-2 C20-methyltransferase
VSGRLIGVGVGPGDPELLTLKGLRALQQADHVFVPVGDTGEIGRAERVVQAHLHPYRARRLLFALSDNDSARAENWERGAHEVSQPLLRGETCAFATIGDPNVYSTFTYLARKVRQYVPEAHVETVPGITAMQDLAARGGAVLLEGEERLALLPFTAGENALRGALSGFETVVCYKGGSRLREVLEIAAETGRLEDAIYGSRLGMEEEEVLQAREVVGREGPYLSTLIFTSRGREFG